MLAVEIHDAISTRLADLVQVAELYSIPVVADSNKRRIKALTGQGVDAFGEVFHVYSKQHEDTRRTQGYPTDTKTLRMGEGRLYQPELVGDSLTYRDDLSRAIGHGQMYHKGWSYHHHFFDVSQEGRELAADELASVLQKHL
jgi:hypothetical protein